MCSPIGMAGGSARCCKHSRDCLKVQVHTGKTGFTLLSAGLGDSVRYGPGTWLIVTVQTLYGSAGVLTTLKSNRKSIPLAGQAARPVIFPPTREISKRFGTLV